jgi:hypothetical protein
MTLRLQPTGEHLDKRGLSGATSDQVAYAQNRDRQPPNTREAMGEERRAERHEASIHV